MFASLIIRFSIESKVYANRKNPIGNIILLIFLNIRVQYLNNKNIAKTEIRFQNVYPTSLGSLNYDVRQTDVDYLSASVSFNYMNYDIVQISTT